MSVTESAWLCMTHTVCCWTPGFLLKGLHYYPSIQLGPKGGGAGTLGLKRGGAGTLKLEGAGLGLLDRKGAELGLSV